MNKILRWLRKIFHFHRWEFIDAYLKFNHKQCTLYQITHRCNVCGEVQTRTPSEEPMNVAGPWYIPSKLYFREKDYDRIRKGFRVFIPCDLNLIWEITYDGKGITRTFRSAPYDLTYKKIENEEAVRFLPHYWTSSDRKIKNMDFETIEQDFDIHKYCDRLFEEKN